MLLKQGDADSFSFQEVLVVIKLHLEQGLQRSHIVKQLCQEGGRAGRPTLCAEDGECRSHGEMEIMTGKVAQELQYPARCWVLVCH